MNIVKMQDSLKDLSDRQLLQTMESGSSPQYLVLAEMQRRKKMREDSAQAGPQSERSVAEDIMGGITQVPMRPMEMAEGGIVSFAKGGKTGRAKGEEEACYIDSRTGEKYCPPSRPQTEMPRTGQRKSFQEGGVIPSSEMADIDLQRARQMYEANLEDLRRVDPNVDFETFLQSYNAVGAPSAPSAPTGPAGEDQGFFGRMESGLTSFLRDIAPGSDVPMEGTGEFAPAAGGSPTSESAAGLPFIRYQDEPLIAPVEDVEQDQARRREEDAAAARGQEAPAEEPAEEDIFRPEPPRDTGDGDEPEVVEQDGLAELMRDLQAERQELRESSREDAINQALIRAGLTMAASDDPDFLSAAAEGGIGGLAGYQSAMERAAQRQGEISSDVIDLGIARETAALKQRAAEAAVRDRISDTEAARIDSLIDFRSTLADQLAESLGDEEATAEIQRQIDAIDAQLAPVMGTGNAAQSFEYDPSSYGT